MVNDLSDPHRVRKPRVLVHTCDPSTGEVEAGRTLGFAGHPA